MRVFHGSDTFIEKIDLAKGAEYLDFGQGFYVTGIRKHAHERSIVKALEICFCTPESLWALNIVDDDTRFDREDMHSLMIETLMNEFDLLEMEAAHKLYRSAVFARLSDMETKLYEKPWTEFYNILKKELQM